MQSGPPTLLNNGVYRQRSYDNLQNGKSPSMQSLTRFVHLPRSSCDHIADLMAAGGSSSAVTAAPHLSGQIGGGGFGGIGVINAIAAMSSDASSSSSSPSPSAMPVALASTIGGQMPAAAALSAVAAPVPTHFQYYAPQQYRHHHRKSVCDAPSIGAFSRYPYHKNRAVPRRPLPMLPLVAAAAAAAASAPLQQQQHQQQMLSGTSADDIRVYLDVNSPLSQENPLSSVSDPTLQSSGPLPPLLLHNVYRYSRHGRSDGGHHHQHHHHHRNQQHRNAPNRYQQRRKSSALSLLKDLDFIDESEDDPMLKDCNQFRVTRSQQYVNGSALYDRDDRSPLKKKQRYSNIYDYSFNLSLNSIHEDSTSDDSL